MDKHGIEYSILSLHNPAVQGVPEADQAIELAKKANDVLAEAVAKRSDRFGGFAALPMQDPDAAIVELTRCVKELGFKGANVNGFPRSGPPVRSSIWTTSGICRSGQKLKSWMSHSTSTPATR